MATKFGIEDGWDYSASGGPFGRSPWRGIMQFLPQFREGLALVVGDGRQVKFWEDLWCGERVLKLNFPGVFDLVGDPSSSVVANYSVSGGGIVWNLVLRRNLQDWEIPRMSEFLARLQTAN